MNALLVRLRVRAGGRPWRRRALALLAVVTAFVTAAGAAYAYFSVSATGSAGALAKTLAAPGAGSVGTATAISLPLSWANSSNLPSSGGTPDGYQVFRSVTSGTQGSVVPSTSGCYGTSGVVAQGTSPTGCTDSGLVPNTTYYYEVTSVYDSWTSVPNTQFSGTTTRQATTTTLGTITPTTGTAGSTSFSATATVTGYGTPAGSVVFSLYTSSTCTAGTAVASSSALTLSGGSATGSITPTSSGTYYWGAAYTSSDTFNTGSTGCNGTTPITVSSATPTFGAADKGAGTGTCTNFTTTHSCTVSGIAKTTSNATELVLVYLSGSNSTSSTIASNGVTGPFSSPQSLTSVEYATSTGKNYLFAYTATGNNTSGSVTITFDSGTTTESQVAVDVVELARGVSVVGTNATAMGRGQNGNGSQNVGVAFSGASSSNSEVVFLGTADNTTFSAPSPAGTWAAVGGVTGTWGAASSFDNPTAQTSATFTEGAANKGWGYIAIQVNP